MSPNPIAAAGRRAQSEHRFGDAPACLRCGISEPEALVPIRRRLLEAHHICGRANDESLTVPVCRNCHAVLTEGQRSAGVTFELPPTLLHQLAAALLSLFAMLHELCERGMQWAHAISNLATELDTTFPEWRSLPSAHAIGGRS
jgi:hypothetical protein